MKELILRNSDKVALVDDEDYERLLQFKWYLKARNNVYRCFTSLYRTKNVPLANEIMRRSGVVFDHIDTDSLNNQKSNLREATYQQNSFNRKKTKVKSSKYKGVSYHKRDKVWCAHIGINGTLVHLGSFKDEVAAAMAYNKKAVELFKEFAQLNQV